MAEAAISIHGAVKRFGPITAVDGYLPIPTGPGLGITLDDAMLARYRV